MGERPLIAVVGGESLLARELLDLLNQSKPAPRLQLISAIAAESSAVIAAVDDEAAVLLPLSGANLEGSRVAFLVGSAASSRRTLKVNPPTGPALIDLSAALEELPDVRLRAPSAEPAPSSNNARVQVIAHPAAIALAMFFTRLSARAPIRRSLVHVFEPASERGKQGLDELQQQTVAVLTFKKQKTDVFDAQLAFNLMARYGEEALEPLESVEQRLERHLASLLAAWPHVPMPSLRLIQAPVFHGHSFSIWVEFVESHSAKELSRMLADADLDVRPDDPPSNAGIAGQSGLSAGAIEEDRNHPRAAWFWMVADNLRLAAENAIAVAQEFL
jgi:aspartate-semialdehyde dehydrogenase